jgi:hypothetical protein
MATAVTTAATSAATESSTDKEDSLAVLKALGEASAVFVALMFVTGWSYLASYYQTFGLNPLELAVPVPVVSTVGFNVLTDARWPLIFAIGLILLVAVLGHWVRRLRWAIVAVLAVLLVFSAAVGVDKGRQVANQDTRMDSTSLPFVAFSSKLKDPSQPSCVDYQTYGSLDCKLLMHSNSTYYFFQPVPAASEAASMNLNLYMLPDSDLNGVHVQRGLDPNRKLIQ